MNRLAFLQVNRWFIGLRVAWNCFAVGAGVSQTAGKCNHCPETHEALVISVSLAFWTVETGFYLS